MKTKQAGSAEMKDHARTRFVTYQRAEGVGQRALVTIVVTVIWVVHAVVVSDLLHSPTALWVEITCGVAVFTMGVIWTIVAQRRALAKFSYACPHLAPFI